MDEENKRQSQKLLDSVKMNTDHVVDAGSYCYIIASASTVCVRLWMGKKPIAEKIVIRCYKMIIYLLRNTACCAYASSNAIAHRRDISEYLLHKMYHYSRNKSYSETEDHVKSIDSTVEMMYKKGIF